MVRFGLSTGYIEPCLAILDGGFLEVYPYRTSFLRMAMRDDKPSPLGPQSLSGASQRTVAAIPTMNAARVDHPPVCGSVSVADPIEGASNIRSGVRRDVDAD